MHRKSCYEDDDAREGFEKLAWPRAGRNHEERGYEGVEHGRYGHGYAKHEKQLGQGAYEPCGHGYERYGFRPFFGKRPADGYEEREGDERPVGEYVEHEMRVPKDCGMDENKRAGKNRKGNDAERDIFLPFRCLIFSVEYGPYYEGDNGKGE